MAGIDVAHDAQGSRYAARLDGEEIGQARYEDDGDRRVFTHTEIDPEHEHHGYAHDLIRAALDDTRSAGLQPVGRCPLVAAFLREHPEYATAG